MKESTNRMTQNHSIFIGQRLLISDRFIEYPDNKNPFDLDQRQLLVTLLMPQLYINSLILSSHIIFESHNVIFAISFVSHNFIF